MISGTESGKCINQEVALNSELNSNCALNNIIQIQFQYVIYLFCVSMSEKVALLCSWSL